MVERKEYGAVYDVELWTCGTILQMSPSLFFCGSSTWIEISSDFTSESHQCDYRSDCLKQSIACLMLILAYRAKSAIFRHDNYMQATSNATRLAGLLVRLVLYLYRAKQICNIAHLLLNAITNKIIRSQLFSETMLSIESGGVLMEAHAHVGLHAWSQLPGSIAS